jgi:hypothetical protein
LTEENRAKAYSMIFGLSIGLSFSTGIPTGAILTATVGPRIAILVSLVISLLTSVYMLLIPINDTLGCKSRHLTNSSKELMMVNSPSEVLAHWDFQYRSFPEKLGSFIHEHLPFTGFFIIVKAKQPLEWLCYFLSQIALQTLILTYLSFGIHTFAWTTPEAGYSLAIVGIVMAIVSPTIAHQFKEKSAIFFGFGFSIIGYILLAICGSNVTDAEFVPRSTVGYFGIFLVTIGFVKEPALATMVSRQYDKDMLGKCTSSYRISLTPPHAFYIMKERSMALFLNSIYWLHSWRFRSPYFFPIQLIVQQNFTGRVYVMRWYVRSVPCGVASMLINLVVGKRCLCRRSVRSLVVS